MIALRRLALALGGTGFIALAAPAFAYAQTAPAPTPLPAPTTTPLPVVPVTPVPVPTATTTPSPLPVPTTSPTPDPYTYVVPAPTPPASAPTDGPQIVDVSLNDRTLRSGGPVLVRVRTSPNVVGVEARAMGRSLAIPQSAPGTFLLSGAIPGGVPFFLLGKHEIVFAALTADGRQTTLSVPVTLAR